MQLSNKKREESFSEIWNKVTSLNKVKIYFLILFLFFTIYIIWETFFLANSNLMKIKFLDVGQGDSILIESPTHKKILIDSGPNGNTLTSLGNELGNKFFLRNLFSDNYDFEIIIATHDDLDHIGALPLILEKYKVKILLTSTLNSKSEAWQKILEIAKEKKIQIKNIDSVGEINLGDGVIIKILFPTQDMSNVEDGNSASIVTQIINRENKFLLTGDLPITGELYLNLVYGKNLKSDILKLGHHGSETSSHPEFLQNVAPQVAIVSAGKNNSFNHPHKSVLDLLEKFKIKVLETSKEKTILFVSDGINIWRE
jgi:competence protein ComEC